MRIRFYDATPHENYQLCVEAFLELEFKELSMKNNFSERPCRHLNRVGCGVYYLVHPDNNIKIKSNHNNIYWFINQYFPCNLQKKLTRLTIGSEKVWVWHTTVSEVIAVDMEIPPFHLVNVSTGGATYVCLMCTSKYYEHGDIDINQRRHNFRTLCESLQVFNLEGTLQKLDDQNSEVNFCNECLLHLDQFRTAQDQLMELNLQIQELRGIISKALLQDSKPGASGTALYELRNYIFRAKGKLHRPCTAPRSSAWFVIWCNNM